MEYTLIDKLELHDIHHNTHVLYVSACVVHHTLFDFCCILLT